MKAYVTALRVASPRPDYIWFLLLLGSPGFCEGPGTDFNLLAVSRVIHVADSVTMDNSGGGSGGVVGPGAGLKEEEGGRGDGRYGREG